jgi:hypothetical protein
LWFPDGTEESIQMESTGGPEGNPQEGATAAKTSLYFRIAAKAS